MSLDPNSKTTQSVSNATAALARILSDDPQTGSARNCPSAQKITIPVEFAPERTLDLTGRVMTAKTAHGLRNEITTAALANECLRDALRKAGCPSNPTCELYTQENLELACMAYSRRKYLSSEAGAQSGRFILQMLQRAEDGLRKGEIRNALRVGIYVTNKLSRGRISAKAAFVMATAADMGQTKGKVSALKAWSLCQMAMGQGDLLTKMERGLVRSFRSVSPDMLNA